MRSVRVRRLGPAGEGDGVEGPVESATMVACLRFCPASGSAGGVILAKVGSGGGGMMATGAWASAALGNTAAVRDVEAGGTTASFGLAFVTENRRDRDRCEGRSACAGRCADGGDGGVEAGRSTPGPDVSMEGVRGVIGAEDTCKINLRVNHKVLSGLDSRSPSLLKVK